jgi:anhydro-N-acetylmuramic acid kinase
MRRETWVIGLMSGTSLDGVDAALVRIRRGGIGLHLRLEGWDTYPYPGSVRESILQACDPETSSVDLVSGLHYRLGELYARACIRLSKKLGVPLNRVDLIGSHGQTVYHNPRPGKETPNPIRSTFQIGEPCVIAERTGITTVADFRARDVAAGGDGAPLSPYLHFLLFRRKRETVAVNNIGGISNVTLLPAGGGLSDVLAFDTGPGNVLIDLAVEHVTGGKMKMDRDSRIAARGKPNGELVQEWLRHPYFRKRPPKSTGREEFGPDFFSRMVRQAERKKTNGENLVASVTRFTAESIVRSYARFFPKGTRVGEIILCGGGAKNPLLRSLIRELSGIDRVTRTDDHGFPAKSLEAVLMAVLAHETVLGRETNLPGVTGASRPAVLGKIVPGGRTR